MPKFKLQKRAILERLQTLRGGSIRGKAKSAAKDVAVVAGIATALAAGHKLGVNKKILNWITSKIKKNTIDAAINAANNGGLALENKILDTHDVYDQLTNALYHKLPAAPSAVQSVSHVPSSILENIGSVPDKILDKTVGSSAVKPWFDYLNDGASKAYERIYGYGVRKRNHKFKKPKRRVMRGRGAWDNFKKAAKVAVPTLGAAAVGAVIAHKMGVGSSINNTSGVPNDFYSNANSSLFPAVYVPNKSILGDANIGRLSF